MQCSFTKKHSSRTLMRQNRSYTSLSFYYKHLNKYVPQIPEPLMIIGVTLENNVVERREPISESVRSNESALNYAECQEFPHQPACAIHSWRCKDILEYAFNEEVYVGGVDREMQGKVYFDIDTFIHKNGQLQTADGDCVCEMEVPAEVAGSSKCAYMLNTNGHMYYYDRYFRSEQQFIRGLRLPHGITPIGRFRVLFLNSEDSVAMSGNVLLLLRNRALVDYFSLQPHYWSTILQKFLPFRRARASTMALFSPYVCIGYQNSVVELYLLENGEFGFFREPQAVIDCKSGPIREILEGLNIEGHLHLLLLVEKNNRLLHLEILPTIKKYADIVVSNERQERQIELIMPLSTKTENNVLVEDIEGRLLEVSLGFQFRYFTEYFTEIYSISDKSDEADEERKFTLCEKLCTIKFSEYHSAMLGLYITRCSQLRVSYKQIEGLIYNNTFLNYIIEEREISDNALIQLSSNCSLNEHFQRRNALYEGFKGMKFNIKRYKGYFKEMREKTIRLNSQNTFLNVNPQKPPVSIPEGKANITCSQSAEENQYIPLGSSRSEIEDMKSKTNSLGKCARKAAAPLPKIPFAAKKSMRISKRSASKADELSEDQEVSAESSGEITKSSNAVVHEQNKMQKSTPAAKLSAIRKLDEATEIAVSYTQEKQRRLATNTEIASDPMDTNMDEQREHQGECNTDLLSNDQTGCLKENEADMLEVFENNERSIKEKMQNAEIKLETHHSIISEATQETSSCFAQITEGDWDVKISEESESVLSTDSSNSSRENGQLAECFETQTISTILLAEKSDAHTTKLLNDRASESSTTSKIDLIDKESSSNHSFFIESELTKSETTSMMRNINTKANRTSKKEQLTFRNAIKAIRDKETTIRTEDHLMENFVEEQAEIEKLDRENETCDEEEELRDQLYQADEVVAIINSNSESRRGSDVLIEPDIVNEKLSYQEKEDRRMVENEIISMQRLQYNRFNSDQMFSELFREIGKILGDFLTSATPEIEPQEDNLFDYGYTFLERLEPVLEAIFFDGHFFAPNDAVVENDTFFNEYYASDLYGEEYLHVASIRCFKRVFSAFYTSMIPQHVFKLLRKMLLQGVDIQERDLHIYPISFIWCHLLRFNAERILDFYKTRKHHYVNEYVTIPCMELFESNYSSGSALLSSAAEYIIFKTRYFHEAVQKFASTRCIDILRKKIPLEVIPMVDENEIGLSFRRMEFIAYQVGGLSRIDEYSRTIENELEEAIPDGLYMYFQPVSVLIDSKGSLSNESKVALAAEELASLHEYEILEQLEQKRVLPYSLLAILHEVSEEDEHPINALILILKLVDYKVAVEEAPFLCALVFNQDIALYWRVFKLLYLEELQLRASDQYFGAISGYTSFLSSDDLYYIEQRFRREAIVRRVRFRADPYLGVQLIDSISRQKLVCQSAIDLAQRLKNKDLEKAVKIENLVLRTLNRDIFVTPTEHPLLEMHSAERRRQSIDVLSTFDENSVDNEVNEDDDKCSITNKRLTKIGEKLCELEMLLQMESNIRVESYQAEQQELLKQSGQALVEGFLFHNGIMIESMKDLRLLYAQLSYRVTEEKQRQGLNYQTEMHDEEFVFNHSECLLAPTTYRLQEPRNIAPTCSERDGKVFDPSIASNHSDYV